jgi:glycosyltransferase involved in cell wall biosynthesis
MSLAGNHRQRSGAPATASIRRHYLPGDVPPKGPVAETDATVVIDARYLNGSESGIGRYTENLIRQLLRVDTGLRLHLVTHPDRPKPVDHPRVTQETFRALACSVRTRLWLARLRDFSGYDLFHSPFNMLPGGLSIPSIFTLHDIMWVLDPHLCSHRWWERWTNGAFFQTVIPRSVEDADELMTISEHSRKEIESHFPAKRGKVHPTYNAVDDYWQPVDPDEGWPLISDIVPPRKKFVLVVGQEAPYKNHPGALAGFINAFREDPDVYFVLVCRLQKNPPARLAELMEHPDVKSRIINPGYVTREQLRALYALARVFLFPSFYEGFGLPSLEAMACGTPVVTSDQGAPAEVNSPAAVTVDPRSARQMGEALQRLAYDDEWYRDRRQAALEHVEQFDWRSTAIDTLAVYRKVLSSYRSE